MATEPNKPTLNVSEPELDEAFSGPAVFTNKFYVTLTGPVARVSFAEFYPDRKPIFRAAVVMTINDLFQLQDAIALARKSATFTEVKIAKPEPGQGDV